MDTNEPRLNVLQLPTKVASYILLGYAEALAASAKYPIYSFPTTWALLCACARAFAMKLANILIQIITIIIDTACISVYMYSSITI